MFLFTPCPNTKLQLGIRHLSANTNLVPRVVLHPPTPEPELWGAGIDIGSSDDRSGTVALKTDAWPSSGKTGTFCEVRGPPHGVLRR